MESHSGEFSTLAHASRNFVRRLMATGENRVELLLLEIHEERQKLLQSLLLALAAAAFGLLAGVALTGVIVVLFWQSSPLIALIVLTLLYAVTAGALCVRLNALQQNWRSLQGTMDQLKKDRVALEKFLS